MPAGKLLSACSHRIARAIADRSVIQTEPCGGAGDDRPDRQPPPARQGLIALGPHEEPTTVGRGLRRRKIGSIGRATDEQEVGALDLKARRACACAVMESPASSTAGGIDQLDCQAVAVARSREIVAGRSRLGRDDGPTIAEQGVKSRLFPTLGGPTRTTRGWPSRAVAVGQTPAKLVERGG